MQRTKGIKPQRKVSAILCSDFHLREDSPVCRTDSFFEAQAKKIKFIKDLQTQHNCPILMAGDLFHAWKSSPFLLAWAIQYLPDNIVAIPGQHDIPQHSMELLHKSGIYVLEQAGKIKLLRENESIVFGGYTVHGYPFGSKPKKNEKEIALWHNLVWQGKMPWPGCTDPNADEVLDTYQNYALIVTGDNHKSFVVRDKDRLLVNPGSITRQNTDQVSHRPRVYLWYAETNTVEIEYLPISDGVISREHLDVVEKRDERIAAFISRLSNDWESDIDFEQNLERFFKENRVKQETKGIIYKSLE
jgi:DNA repair exonuclease SbcCD nuclease subunit